ncbi:alpha/beta fold hydrolase [Bacillus sp. UMB0893]|uniref:alpha/beta fold hydrolase n=1 Tax=Bacillus sp. UMB0893 TaxID=2066053 RepID=UPI000C762364|nr:alpha/beta hydrolase [Bacillus sp. UMB0893]PLR66251.1 alpha/beta hydrolase [Bacillus sp. UMB0893]
MPLIKLNSQKYLHFEEFGQGIPIIFIHPPGMGNKVFYYQHALSKHLRVILPDLSGHGESNPSEQGVSIPYYANEILDFMDALNLKKAVLCGYSAGCLIAQHLAICHPNRIELLILSGAYPLVKDFSGQLLHNLGIYMVQNHLNLLIKIISKSHTKDKNVRKTLAVHMKKADKNVWSQYYFQSLQYSCLDQLHHLTMPTLFMYGGEGDWTKHYLNYYKKICKHAEFFLFTNENHQLPTKKWNSFNEIITGFVLTKSNL